MAEVIVLYAPKDGARARSAIAGLTNMRALMVPLTPRAHNYQLGARMVRVVIWSAVADEAGVAAAFVELGAHNGAPLVLALCDDTPPPAVLKLAARATIAVSDEAASQAEFASSVQTLFNAEWGAPVAGQATSSVMKRNVLAVVIAGVLALGVAAGVSAWAPHFAGAQGAE